ncbi:hypothetical protein RQM65_03525 [Pricia sp. S334]|uniref:Lipocalin-like domain-containing protein n=1 Tax=Pricia mediterranea TaxID=3076079 RepID=A0ABU3L1X6_9FLAO|nr:hypothetical protein [Pricia sp. S334]MDT7827734.1 hypothetical protein [Pricia sp. S334]
MKKLFSLLAILGIIAVSNCTRLPENNNPIIGIWTDLGLSKTTETAGNQALLREWVFNDAYLGRYHEIRNGHITFKTDFHWSYENEEYGITYLDPNNGSEVFSLQKQNEVELLSNIEGHVIARRE